MVAFDDVLVVGLGSEEQRLCRRVEGACDGGQQNVRTEDQSKAETYCLRGATA